MSEIAGERRKPGPKPRLGAQVKQMVYLDTDVHEELRRIAFEERTSIAELIRAALRERYGGQPTTHAG